MMKTYRVKLQQDLLATDLEEASNKFREKLKSGNLNQFTDAEISVEEKMPWYRSFLSIHRALNVRYY